MDSNYNDFYPSNHDITKWFSEGDIFDASYAKNYRYGVRFHGLPIKSVGYKGFGSLCFSFDWHEWQNNVINKATYEEVMRQGQERFNKWGQWNAPEIKFIN